MNSPQAEFAEAGLATPVIFTLFNRPETTALTFARIVEAKPRQLFLIADGPRANHPTDVERCAAARAVVEHIDWDCEVHRHFSETNWGPRCALASGINKAFELFETAIFLEDDMLVDPTYFRFAEEMLERYRHDERIMNITASSSVPSFRQPANYPYSYYFSHYGSTWGFATWRRAWQTYYDVDMKLWTPLLKAELAKHPGLNQTVINNFEAAYQGLETWDYQWTFALRIQSGLSIVPVKNLIRNIGYGPQATNTTNVYTRSAAKTTVPQSFPLLHPPTVMPWPSYERVAQRIQQGFHWRNQLAQYGPQWLVKLGMRAVRWLEKQQARRAMEDKNLG